MQYHMVKCAQAGFIKLGPCVLHYPVRPIVSHKARYRNYKKTLTLASMSIRMHIPLLKMVFNLTSYHAVSCKLLCSNSQNCWFRSVQRWDNEKHLFLFTRFSHSTFLRETKVNDFTKNNVYLFTQLCNFSSIIQIPAFNGPII